MSECFVEESEKIEVLNRIDQEYPCNYIVWVNKDGPEYCEIPEWDPFSNRCFAHTPGT